MPRYQLVSLIVFAACGGKQPAPAPSAPSDAAAPMEQPPPADAAVTEESAIDAGAAPTADTPAPSSGTGDASKLEAHVSKQNKAIATCWKSSKGSEPKAIEGVKKLNVQITVGSGGAVESVKLQTLPAGTKLETCLTDLIKKWKIEGLQGTFAFTMIAPI